MILDLISPILLSLWYFVITLGGFYAFYIVVTSSLVAKSKVKLVLILACLQSVVIPIMISATPAGLHALRDLLTLLLS
ncbi:MAG: hypothetical protein UT34_C0001G0322 [candidate division WS6 bacterium GW2011_GWF2_39_15]|uniref:Uncharacterized protein n=1 Tax=candidate division WS6 bacterium GW2011_GWF2_39_15 TaxID=1619100 RepID=A0A0G0QXD4_9BACT|nr:MAG: hypothetical protein UT34_C0001G0322 [candidate division WS6 bacterium GW2011_GWF2_39_15]